MNWLELSVHTSSEAVEAVSNLLQEVGAEGVSIEDPEVLNRHWENQYGEIIELKKEDYPEYGVIVKAYFPDLIDFESIVSQVKQRVEQLSQFGLDPGPGIVRTSLVDEESWANKWKKYYKPVRISPRLTIKPVWEAYQAASPDERIIELDPGMAFGTGTHPTTVLSLKMLEKYLFPESRVIDVGCGSGILSIAAAKLGAKKVLALDLDPLAVEKSKENVRLNQVEPVVEVRQGDLLKGVAQTADCVVANILAEIIVKFVHDLPRVLVPGGIFVGSGIIKEKSGLVLSALNDTGLQVLETIHQEDWVAIVAKKW
ncbi:50S ribosomal protein L11 methyltransferase [Thermoflavimicrobium dichotomicum]|uniref:Ribosomal protein L11 methyltransferase n=1 Tax=Thermoflavimicrobium dichotomicum TaxID=46223 RepID=A0A1I3NJG3_9BACL|nr:50S ribosomal protein L11 methyltransferase [Thermoflavimicrobium dichotomicum]SFJ09309.1 ribosomal protein L11 methyltransferase [Thermoflavimicrobium dichotomicum]